MRYIVKINVLCLFKECGQLYRIKNGQNHGYHRSNLLLQDVLDKKLLYVNPFKTLKFIIRICNYNQYIYIFKINFN